MNEFRARHLRNRELDEAARQISAEEGTEYRPVSRFRIDHTNMQSAQVNQMTSQLKERVELVRKYYNLKSREEIREKTGIDVVYDDLISEEDGEIRAERCKKDFRRLEKYQVLNIGEGHFMDESDEPDSEDEKQKQEGPEEERESVPLEGLLFHRGDRGQPESGEEEFDHNKFMEEMMKNIQEQQNSDEAD